MIGRTGGLEIHDEGLQGGSTKYSLKGPDGKHAELCDQEVKPDILQIVKKPFKM